TINGVALAPGCKDPFLLAERIDDLWGQSIPDDPDVSRPDRQTIVRTLNLMQSACGLDLCHPRFKQWASTMKNDILTEYVQSDEQFERDLKGVKAIVLLAGGAACLGELPVCVFGLGTSLTIATGINATVYGTGDD